MTPGRDRRRGVRGFRSSVLAAGLVLAGGRGMALAVVTNPSPVIVPAPTPTPAVVGTNAPLRDIHGVVEIPDPWRTARWGIGGGCVLALAAGAAFWWWRLRQQAAALGEPLESPAVGARRRLAAAREWMGDPRRFAGVVSDAVRLYLEERFGLRAPEQTTEEFLSDLRSRPLLDVRHQASLAGFLEQCDLLKFAGARPGPEELEELLAAAGRLVDDTDPAASAGPSGAAGMDPVPAPGQGVER